MSPSLKLHELTGSPNNVKVRIALGYKGLPYERLPIDLSGPFPGDRSRLVTISGQPRTPVLQHGDVVMFDSSAILRYLDANFRDTPPLFSDDYGTMGVIEQWEGFARAELGPPIASVFGQAMAEKADAAVIEQANAALHEATNRIEGRLAESKFLVRDTPSGADLATAPPLHLAMLSEKLAAEGPIHRFFHDHLHLGDDRDRTRAWVKALMAHDEVFAAS